MTSASRHRGQVLVAMLALWAALLGGLLLLHNAGQTVAAKLRVVNAADAAAYSAAVWQARALNLQAYANRAMVANEAAIAQLVSLRSWSGYLQRTLVNGSTALAWVPYLNELLASVSRAWRPVDHGLQTGLPPLEALASRLNTQALLPAERIAQAESFATSLQVARQVLRDNLPGAQLDQATVALLPSAAARWRASTRDYRGADRNRLARVVLDARDGFTRRRNWERGLGLVSASKRGGTDLIGNESWRGMDTMSVHLAGLFGASELPVGWGTAENQHLAQRARGEHGGSWSRNPRASRLAARGGQAATGYRGLPGFRDLTAARRGANPAFRVVLGASLDGADVPSSDRVLSGASVVAPGLGVLPFRARFAGGRVQALAAAAVSFRRAVPRRDGREEYASLFSPYWQARLVNPAARERLLAAAARGEADPWTVTR